MAHYTNDMPVKGMARQVSYAIHIKNHILQFTKENISYLFIFEPAVFDMQRPTSIVTLNK